MIRVLAALLLVITTASLGLAQEETVPLRPELRVVVEPRHVLERGAYVQGQIRLRILLLSPRQFETLVFRPPQLDGATIVTLSPPRTYALTYSDQEGYGYETHLAIFPERSGVLTIPDITITGETASVDGETMAFSTRGAATTIRVRPIDPSFGGDWWLVSEDIAIEEQWTPAPETLRVGAVVERRVTLTATGVRPEQLPPLRQPENDGYAIVGETNQRTMELTTDGIISRVVQVWTLRILGDDVFEVSPIVINYWNPASDQPGFAWVPSKRIEPLVRDVETARQVLIDEATSTHRGRKLGVMMLFAIPAGFVVALLLAFAYRAWPSRADRALVRRCRNANGNLDGFAAAHVWARESFARAGGAPLAEARDHMDTRGAAALERLQSALFSPSTASVNVDQIAREIVGAARRARLRAFVGQIAARLSHPFRARQLFPR